MHLSTSILVAIVALTGSASAFRSSQYGLRARDIHDNIDLYARDAYLDERDFYESNLNARDVYLDERDVYDDIYARDLGLLERSLGWDKAGLSRRALPLEHYLHARTLARPNLGGGLRLTPGTMARANQATPQQIPFTFNGPPEPHHNNPANSYFPPGQPPQGGHQGGHQGGQQHGHP